LYSGSREVEVKVLKISSAFGLLMRFYRLLNICIKLTEIYSNKKSQENKKDIFLEGSKPNVFASSEGSLFL